MTASKPTPYPIDPQRSMTDAQRKKELLTTRTVGNLVNACARALDAANLSFGHGSDNAQDEAIHLVLFSLGIAPSDFQSSIDDCVSVDQWNAAEAMIQLRISGRQPAPYLTGLAWLHGLSFLADERALVPRSLLVEAMCDSMVDWMQTLLSHDYPTQWPTRILDLCCGSGSIAIHAALLFPNATLVASDLSDAALDLCLENLERHGLTDRIERIQSDCFQYFDQDRPQAPFDLILCNPPYVNDSAMRELPREFLAEPDRALRGGADGMDLIADILEQAPEYMADNAILLLEIGHEASGFESRFDTLEFSYLPVTAGDQMVIGLTREQIIKLNP